MKNLSRRRFIALGGVGIATVPLSSMLNSAIADELPMVDTTSPVAMGLQYAEMSTKDDQNCANCMHYKAEADAAAGVCPFFKVAWLVKRPGAQLGALWLKQLALM